MRHTRGDDFDDAPGDEPGSEPQVGSIMQLNDEPCEVDPEKQPIGFRFSENK